MRYDELNKLLIDFKPNWMIIYPDLAMYLCELIETGKINLIDSVKYIELTGEIQILKDISMLKILFEFEFVDYISPCVGGGKTGWFKSDIITDF